MTTTATSVTVLKLLETLPEGVQERVLDHLREYIEEIRDEERWTASYARTRGKLAEAAIIARQAVADGKSKPLDPESL
jgi:hypothetical protein